MESIRDQQVEAEKSPRWEKRKLRRKVA